MDRYALDANAIREDFRFRQNPGRLLLREARNGRIHIVVPQVAFDEAVNLYREEVDARVRDARRARRKLLALGALSEEELLVEVEPGVAAAAYTNDLREIFESAQATFLPYPTATHEDVARRAMDRRRPFDAEGKDGYRDTLLWETLLEAADIASPIVLVTGDNAAFSSKKQSALLPELQDELAERGFSRDAVRRIKSVSDYTSTLPSVPELGLEVEHVIATRASVREFLTDALTEEALDYSETGTSVIGLPLEVDQLYVDVIDSVSNLVVVAARELEDGTAAVELHADIAATLQIYVHKSEAIPYEEEDAWFTDYDYNDSFAEGYVNRTIRAEFEALYDARDESLTRVVTHSFVPLAPAP